LFFDNCRQGRLPLPLMSDAQQQQRRLRPRGRTCRTFPCRRYNTTAATGSSNPHISWPGQIDHWRRYRGDNRHRSDLRLVLFLPLSQLPPGKPAQEQAAAERSNCESKGRPKEW
jgi:hypothetical protein